jgi:hypothetical protein
MSQELIAAISKRLFGSLIEEYDALLIINRGNCVRSDRDDAAKESEPRKIFFVHAGKLLLILIQMAVETKPRAIGMYVVPDPTWAWPQSQSRTADGEI